jgi:hypothetical protein
MSEEQELSREEDERLMGTSAILILPIMIGGVIYIIYLQATNVIHYYEGILYTFLLLAPITMALCFTVYEILFSRKIKKTFKFHFKRFLSHMTLLAIPLYLTALWGILHFLLSPPMADKHVLLLSAIILLFTLAIVVAIPKTRHLISKLTKGE